MTTGITKALPTADDYDGVLSLAKQEVDRAAAQFGVRAADRYSTSIGDSYRDQRYAFLAQHEGVRTKVYMDAGSPTIGLGFHMDEANSKAVWKQAFGDAVSFEDARAGRTKITPAQARTLFDHSALYYEKLVDAATKGHPLSQSSRVGLFSVAYNAPKRFNDEVAPLLRVGDMAGAADAILTKTFAPGNASLLKGRRYDEATLFLSASDAANVMPTFQAYDASVEVNHKTGVSSLRAVGSADVSDMDPEFQKRIANLFADAPANIRDGLGVYSGYRSVSYQKDLFDKALKKYGSVAEARKWVAPPGRSQHGRGFAADLSYNGDTLAKAPADVVDWLHANAGKYNLTFPLSNENWHIEPVEARKTGVLLPLSDLRPITGLKVTQGDPDAPTPMPNRPAMLDKKTAPTPMPGRPAKLGGGYVYPNNATPQEVANATLQPAGVNPEWVVGAGGAATLRAAASAEAATLVPNATWGNGIWGLPRSAKTTTVNVHLDGTITPVQGAGTEELPHDLTLDSKTGKFVKRVPVAPVDKPGWLTTAIVKASGKVGVGGGVMGNATLVKSSQSVQAVTAPIPYSRPAALSSVTTKATAPLSKTRAPSSDQKGQAALKAAGVLDQFGMMTHT